jgi:hypothetical protein
VDRELSCKLTAERLNKEIDMTAETAFFDPVVQTGPTGRASSVIRISPQLPASAVVVMLLDAAEQTETVIYRIPEDHQ